MKRQSTGRSGVLTSQRDNGQQVRLSEWLTNRGTFTSACCAIANANSVREDYSGDGDAWSRKFLL